MTSGRITRRVSRATGARSSAALPALLVLALGCGTTAERAREAPSSAPEPPALALVQGDPAAAATVRRALPAAVARLAARGLGVQGTPRIVVHATSAGFLQATGQIEPSLRAWTTWNTVHLMPLDAWANSDDEGVLERVTHELCHVALYQRFGSEARARAARIPRFFEEGVCSVTAGQARPDLMTIAYVAPPMPLEIGFFVADPEVAYAAAHHAVLFLDRKLEPAWLHDVLDRAAQDGTAGAVERALLDVTGYTPVTLWRAVVESVARPA